jgi:hypothetical protein
LLRDETPIATQKEKQGMAEGRWSWWWWQSSRRKQNSGVGLIKVAAAHERSPHLSPWRTSKGDGSTFLCLPEAFISIYRVRVIALTSINVDTT